MEIANLSLKHRFTVFFIAPGRILRQVFCKTAGLGCCFHTSQFQEEHHTLGEVENESTDIDSLFALLSQAAFYGRLNPYPRHCFGVSQYWAWRLAPMRNARAESLIRCLSLRQNTVLNEPWLTNLQSCACITFASGRWNTILLRPSISFTISIFPEIHEGLLLLVHHG